MSYADKLFIKTLLLIVSTMFSLVAQAVEWKTIQKNEQASFYYDSSSIQLDGDIAQILNMVDFKMKDRIGFNVDKGTTVAYRSAISLVEINCKTHTYRTLRTSMFSSQMGVGEKAAPEMVTQAASWKHIEQAGLQDNLRLFACPAK